MRELEGRMTRPISAQRRLITDHLRGRLQGAGRLPLLQRTAHGRGRGPPDRRGHPTPPHPAVGALRPQEASALPAPEPRGGECRARHLHPGAPDCSPRREPGCSSLTSRRAARSHLLPPALRELGKSALPLPRTRSRRRDLRRGRARCPLPRGHRIQGWRRGGAGPHGTAPRSAVVRPARATGPLRGGGHAHLARDRRLFGGWLRPHRG